MKVVLSLKRAVALPVVAGSIALAPVLAFSTHAFAAATTYYWAGSHTAYSLTNTNTPSLDVSNPNNWSTSSSAYAAATSLDAGSTYDIKLTTGTTTFTGTLPNAAQEIELLTSGSSNPATVTWATTGVGAMTAGTAINMVDGGIIKVDASSTDSLDIPYVNDPGALTIDGANVDSAGSSAVVGPLTLEDTSGTTTWGADPTYLTGVLGTAGNKTAIIGDNTVLTLSGTDSSNFTVPSYWTLQVDPGGTIVTPGAVPNTGNGNHGNTYTETFIGNGGTFKVSGGTATYINLSLTANTYGQVPAATDVLTTQNYTPGSFSMQLFPNSNGTLPGGVSGTGDGSGTGSGNDNGNGSGTGGGSDNTGTSSTGTDTTPVAAPGTPDTGFALVASHALPVLAIVTAAAGAMVFAARRMGATVTSKR